jgi:hypothetical protein
MHQLLQRLVILLHLDADQKVINNLRSATAPINISNVMRFIRYVTVADRLDRLGIKHAGIIKGFRGTVVT